MTLDTLRVVELVVLAVLFAGALGALAYSASYRRKLRTLATAAKRFSEGNRSVSFDVSGPQEIENIAAALEEMRRVINITLEDLKMEERRQIRFVSDVSHEIRTPLTAIRGAAETLLDGDVPAEDQQRFLTTIGSEAERLTRLANDLLTLQRIEGGTGELPVKRVELRPLIDSVANMMEPLLEERGVQLEVTGTAPAVLGDVDRLHQVLANLIDNASRYVDHDDGRVRVELAGVDNQAVISVIDNGPGIEDGERLFDRFYRADAARSRAEGGTGLGLAIVKAIVTAHGGSVNAINLPDNGACFVMRLPAIAPIESRNGSTSADPFA